MKAVFMRRARSSLAGLALMPILALMTMEVRAQTWKGEELEWRMSQARWDFGPFLIQPSLVISNAGIDSNIYYSPYDPIRDFTLTAGPAATFYLPVRRKLVLSVHGSPQYVWYSKTERERSWNYFLDGALQLNLKSAFFSIEGVYSDARQRWNTEIDIRPRRQELGYGGSALLKVGHKTSFEVGLRTVKYDYESVEYAGGFNVRERLNRQESYTTLSTYYQIARERRFFLDLEYGRYDFEFATQATIRDSDSYTVRGGLEFSQFGRRIRGRIRLGYKKFDVVDPDSPDFAGVVGDTNLSIRLTTILAVRGSYIRNVDFSLWYGEAYYVVTRPGAGLSLYPLPFVRLDYDYSTGKNKYPVTGEVPEDLTRLDKIDIHSSGIYFRIVENTAIGFVVSLWKRVSNIEGEDDERLFYGLNLTYDF